MGLILDGAIKGIGEGVANTSMLFLKDKLEREREEANFLRKRELGETEAKAKGLIETAKMEQERDLAAEKNKTTLEAARIKSTGKGDPTSGMSLADRQKAARKVISEVTAGNLEYREMKPEELDAFKRQTYLDYGLDSSGENLVEKSSLPSTPEVKKQPEPTVEDQMKARKWYKDTASMLESDKSQFGMTESEVVAKKAREFAAERSGKGGLISGAMGEKPEQNAGAITEAQYRKMMKDKYSDIPDDVLNKKVAAARKAGRIQ